MQQARGGLHSIFAELLASPHTRADPQLVVDRLLELVTMPAGTRPFRSVVGMEPAGDVLYANDWLGNPAYVLHLHDPLHPRLLRKFGSVGTFGYPRSSAYLANGNTLATFQYSGRFNRAADGLGEFEALSATIDRRTGKLTLESDTIDFTGTWPAGWRRSAMPHGAAFSNP